MDSFYHISTLAVLKSELKKSWNDPNVKRQLFVHCLVVKLCYSNPQLDWEKRVVHLEQWGRKRHLHHPGNTFRISTPDWLWGSKEWQHDIHTWYPQFNSRILYLSRVQMSSVQNLFIIPLYWLVYVGISRSWIIGIPTGYWVV